MFNSNDICFRVTYCQVFTRQTDVKAEQSLLGQIGRQIQIERQKQNQTTDNGQARHSGNSEEVNIIKTQVSVSSGVVL